MEEDILFLWNCEQIFNLKTFARTDEFLIEHPCFLKMIRTTLEIQSILTVQHWKIIYTLISVGEDMRCEIELNFRDVI